MHLHSAAIAGNLKFIRYKVSPESKTNITVLPAPLPYYYTVIISLAGGLYRHCVQFLRVLRHSSRTAHFLFSNSTNTAPKSDLYYIRIIYVTPACALDFVTRAVYKAPWIQTERKINAFFPSTLGPKIVHESGGITDPRRIGARYGCFCCSPRQRAAAQPQLGADVRAK